VRGFVSLIVKNLYAGQGTLYAGGGTKMLNEWTTPPNSLLLGNPQSTLLDADGSMWLPTQFLPAKPRRTAG
jgi:hypothetical protein